MREQHTADCVCERPTRGSVRRFDQVEFVVAARETTQTLLHHEKVLDFTLGVNEIWKRDRTHS